MADLNDEDNIEGLNSEESKIDGSKIIQNGINLIKKFGIKGITTILSTLLIIIIVIGILGFLFTMPGLAISKIKETCEAVGKWLTGEESIGVDNDAIDDLANYIQERGYDLVGFGFASSNSVTKTRDSDTNNVTSVHVDLSETPDMPSAQAEIISLTNDVNKVLTTGTTISNIIDADQSKVVFPYSVMNDANIVKVTKDGQTKFYRAVDENGNDIKLLGNSKYTVEIDENGNPVFRKNTNGDFSVGTATNVDGYSVSNVGYSYNEFLSALSTISDENVANQKLTELKNSGYLDNQANYITRLINAYGYSGNSWTDVFKNFKERYVGIDTTDGKSIINALFDYTLRNDIDMTTKIQIWEEFQTLINSVSSDLKENATQIQIEYYTRRQNLFSYVLANERTYTTQGTEHGIWEFLLNGNVSPLGHILNSIIKKTKNDDPKKYGMLKFNTNIWDQYRIELKRESNELLITAKNGFLGLNRDQFKWSLTGWTSRYGKPIELSLALHLATMAPDFAYDFCTDSALQTLVNINTHKVTYNMDYKYKKDVEGASEFYKNDKVDPITHDTIDGIITTYNKLKEGRDHYYRIKRLFTKNVEIEQDETMYTKENGYDLPILAPIDIISNGTSIISIQDENGKKRYYKMLDETGKPIKISFSGCTVDSSGFHANDSAFNIKYREDGETPYFEIATNDRFDINTLDFLSNNEININNNKKISLEILSIRDLEKFLDTVYFDTVNNGVLQFKLSINGDNTAYRFARYKRYIRTLEEYDKLMNDTLENNILISDKIDEIKENCHNQNINLSIHEVSVDVSDPGVQAGWAYSKNSHTYYLVENNPRGSIAVTNGTHKFIEIMSGGQYSYNTKGFLDSLCNSMNNVNNKEQYSYIFARFNNILRARVKNEVDILVQEDQRINMFEDTCNKIFEDKMKEIKQKYKIDSFSEIEVLYNAFKDLPDTVETYKPYIESVTNHWYKDLDFGNVSNNKKAYEAETNNVTKTADFMPDENTSYYNQINDLKENAEIKYEITNSSDDIKQVNQPDIIKDKEWHYMVKNWILYGFYFIYDGTEETAKKIEQAQYILSYDGLRRLNYSQEDAKKMAYDPTNPLLIEMNKNDGDTDQKNLSLNAARVTEIENKAKELNSILENSGSDVRLKHIVFNQKNALENAFPILENMHTEDSEYIYRDLKEFLMELGYFTRADFESIDTDVFDWIIPTYKVYKDQWPNAQNEKDSMQYGTFVRSKTSLDAQKEAASDDEKKNIKITGFKSGLEIIAPENGEIIDVGSSSIESDKYMDVTGNYVTIQFNTGNGVNGWKMKIEGLQRDVNKNDIVKKGVTSLGKTTDSNLKITLFDDKNAIIDNIEDYFKLLKKAKIYANISSDLGEIEDIVEYVWRREGGATTIDGDYYTVIHNEGDVPTVGNGLTGATWQTWHELGFSEYIDQNGNFLVDKIPISVADRVAEQEVIKRFEKLDSKLNEYGVTDWGNDQKNAILSLGYNLGEGCYDDVIQLYKNNGTEAVINYMISSWHSGNDPAFGAGLRARRIEETEIFLHGNYNLDKEEMKLLHRQYYGYDY